MENKKTTNKKSKLREIQQLNQTITKLNEVIKTFKNLGIDIEILANGKVKLWYNYIEILPYKYEDLLAMAGKN